MANAYEVYVQTELPKRPFLPTDVQTESIIIRRGQGARQLTGIKLAEGEVLGMVSGVLTGIEANQGAQLDVAYHEQQVASTTWTITHNRNNLNVVPTVYDSTGSMIFPNSISVTENTTSMDFTTAQSGRAILLFTPVPEVEDPV